MKTLNVIQKLFRLGKVLSSVMFVFCVVGFCGGTVGIVSMATGAPTLKIGGVTLRSILKVGEETAPGAVYAAMAAAMILCAGEAVLAKFAEHYFRRELDDGTPFTLGGAKALMRLGILAICIPLGAQTIAAIVSAAAGLSGDMSLKLSSGGSVALGAMLLVTSLICRYGAELYEEKQAKRQR